MSKNRTNSSLLFKDLFKNYDYFPETPIIPNIAILSEPAVLVIPPNQNFEKKLSLKEKKTEKNIRCNDQKKKK